jgi:septal ring factor EnvC (AmiA/AmiB activator)
VYFDGLNRFYIAQEHGHLRASFSAPPNYFDEYVRHAEVTAQTHVQETEAELAATRSRIQETEAELAATRSRVQETEAELAATRSRIQETEAELAVTRSRVQETEAELAAVYASRSWRLTRPIRRLMTSAREVFCWRRA